MSKRPTIILFIAFIALIILLMKESPTYSTEIKFKYDGWFWASLPEEVKLGYVIGLVRGVNFIVEQHNLYLRRSEEAMNAAQTCTEKDRTYIGILLDKVSERIGEFAFSSPTTYGRIRDGIDKFYKDERNRSILIVDSLRIVEMQVAGKSQPEIRGVVENLKRRY